MRFAEQLRGGLAEAADLVLDGGARHRLRELVEPHAAFVRQVVEHVCRTNRLGPWKRTHQLCHDRKLRLTDMLRTTKAVLEEFEGEVRMFNFWSSVKLEPLEVVV